MACQARKERTRAGSGEVVSGQGLRRLKGGQPEARHAEWMTRNAERGRKDVFSELLPIIHGWLDQAAPRITIGAESALRVTEAALKNHRGAIVEGMGERRIAVDPIEPVIRKRERGEEGRARGEWMHGGAKVVQKAGERERQRAGCATGFGFGLEDLDGEPGLREHNGRGEPVGARSDYASAAHGVIVPHSCGSSSSGHWTTLTLPSAVSVISGA